MSKDIIEELKKVPIFSALSESDLIHILPLMNRTVLHKGKHIFFEGDPIQYFCFISSGTVKIYRTDIQGKEQIVSIFKSGHFFPHIGLFSDQIYPGSSIVTSEKATVYQINVKNFREMLMQNPAITLKFIGDMETRISDLQVRLADQIFHNTTDKIMQQLTRLAKEHGEDQGEWVFINILITNLEIANMIGTTRESVNRSLSKLKNKSFIRIDKKGYISVAAELMIET